MYFGLIGKFGFHLFLWCCIPIPRPHKLHLLFQRKASIFSFYSVFNIFPNKHVLNDILTLWCRSSDEVHLASICHGLKAFVFLPRVPTFKVLSCSATCQCCELCLCLLWYLFTLFVFIFFVFDKNTSVFISFCYISIFKENSWCRLSFSKLFWKFNRKLRFNWCQD